MKLAMVVEVVLAVELVLSTELAREAVRAFTMKCLLVTLEMLVASERLVATRVVALAHSPPDNIDLCGLRLVRSFP